MAKVTRPRKKRVMSAEQKAAAAERLAKAREKRMKTNPPEYKSIHPSVLKLEEDHPLSMQSCRHYIKTQRQLMARYKSEIRNNIKGAEAKYHQCENYIRNIQSYLSNGVWVDLFYGELQQYRMGWRTIVPAG